MRQRKAHRRHTGTHRELLQSPVGPGPLSPKVRGPEPVPAAELPTDPVALYRMELERSRHRRAAAKKAEMAIVTKAYKARLAKDAEAGKGGRPKGQPTIGIEIPSRKEKPGKPHLMVQRRPLVDLVESLEPFFGR